MRVPFKKMGKRAVEIIVENQEKTDWKDLGDVFFHAAILARESCGCLAKASEQIILEKQRDYEKKRAEGNRNLQFDYMSIYLSEADSIEDMESGKAVAADIYIPEKVFTYENYADYMDSRKY